MTGGPLDRGRKSAARLALYGSGTVIVVLALLAVKWVQFDNGAVGGGWREEKYPRHPVVQLLRDYVRVDTRKGKEIDGARFLADRLAQAGIEATIEPLGNGRANLWAILEGRNPDALVLHHHIDVWEIDGPEEWLYPPFAADVDGPWLYGRGTFDMKSYGVAQLLAFLRAAKLEQPLERTLILLATSDEEAGSDLGTRWVLSQHPDLADRFWGVLTEGGIVEALSETDIKYWGIETSQLSLLTVRLCSPSRSRVEDFVADLAEWPATEISLRLTDELEMFLADYAPTRAQELTRANLGDYESMLRNRRGFRRLPQYLQDLFFDGISPATITETDNGYEVDVLLFLLPGSDPAEVVARLLPPWLTHGLTVTVGHPVGARNGSPVDHPLFLTAVDSLQRAYPESRAGAYFLASTVTDARFFREAGIPAYGYSPFLFFSTDTMRKDRINERIPMPGFVSGVEIYGRLVEELVSESTSSAIP